jgi:hypothetical protein
MAIAPDHEEDENLGKLTKIFLALQYNVNTF